jgi:integrase
MDCLSFPLDHSSLVDVLLSILPGKINLAVQLTDRSIRALRPRKVDFYVFDSEVSGLAIRTYTSGRKVWVFDWRTDRRQRRVTLGQHPSWTVGKARAYASKLRVRVDSGEDIAPARGQQIAELIETWLETVRLTRRPGTAAGYRRLITAHIIPIFGKDVPAAITRNRIEAWHGRIAARTSTHANRALGTLSAFMSWLERDGKITGNPCRGVRRRPENQRHVFLGAAEIAAAHRALDGDNQSRPAALALRLALMTGCRIGEAIGIKADQIDAARRVWTKPASHTKQRKLHVVPLTAEALSVAQELLRLPRPKYEDCRQAWLRARKTIGREDTRVHDLRHSYASSLARNGASLVQIGKLLGHTAPITTARYLHLIDQDLRDLVERSR